MYFAIPLRRTVSHEQETKLRRRKGRNQAFTQNEETCTIWKNVRGRRTKEDANQMPDEERSSH